MKVQVLNQQEAVFASFFHVKIRKQDPYNSE